MVLSELDTLVGCHPSDLWVSYFTSSKYVQEFRKEHGDPDIVEVRQVFPTDTLARDWESTVIRRIGAVYSDRWLNRFNPKGKFYNVGPMTDSAKDKLRMNNAMKDPIKAAKNADAQRGKKRNPHSEETRRKISESNKGKIHSNYNPPTECPHCKKVIRINHLSRHIKKEHKNDEIQTMDDH